MLLLTGTAETCQGKSDHATEHSSVRSHPAGQTGTSQTTPPFRRPLGMADMAAVHMFNYLILVPTCDSCSLLPVIAAPFATALYVANVTTVCCLSVLPVPAVHVHHFLGPL